MFTVNQNDQLRWSTLPRFMNPLSNLNFFVDNFELPENNYERQRFTKEATVEFIKGFQKHSIKILKIWKRLLERIDDRGFGITSLHSSFLAYARSASFFDMGWEVIESCSLPKHTTSISQCADYHFEAGRISMELEKYEEANSFFKKYLNMEGFCQNQNQMIYALINRILLGKLFRRPISSMHITAECEKIFTISSVKSVLDEDRIRKQLSCLMEYCKELHENKQLSAYAKSWFEQHDKHQILRLISQEKLRSHIAGNLMHNAAELNAKQISDVSLVDFQNIKSLNRPYSLYKYDCRNRKAIFTFQSLSQSEIDSKVVECGNMYTAVKHAATAKSQREEDFSMGGFSAISSILGSMRRR